ncbi:DUF5132 domain-containing protein [Kitasatospora sp. NPDC097643]|uniref:DUF5132 domain-containing protein n=1 Tax=Kitasatospora sp. NPDC097643 TaxID=3157230 RepID=UPI003327DDC6
MPPVVPPFLVGLIVAPLAKRIAKPLLRGIVKTSIGLVVEVKKVAHEASEGIQDLAAEVTAEMSGSDVAVDPADSADSGNGKAGKARNGAPAPVPATVGSGAKSG